VSLRGLVAFTVAAVVAFGSDARAEEPLTPQAKDHFDRANAFYNGGKYDQAIKELEIGYALQPHSAFLYAWAQNERKRGRCDEAVRRYQQFLKHDITPEQRKAAEANIARCPVAPPKQDPPPPPPPPAASTYETTPWYRDRTGNLLAGSGAVVTGLGGVFFALSVIEHSKAKDAQDHDTYGDHIESARRDRFISIGCFTVGAALITAGIVHYARRDQHGIGVTAFVRGDGGGLALATRF
jgi:tetratricopeptide (TPR) repeat protein